jgi:hypothetical protein
MDVQPSINMATLLVGQKREEKGAIKMQTLHERKSVFRSFCSKVERTNRIVKKTSTSCTLYDQKMSEDVKQSWPTATPDVTKAPNRGGDANTFVESLACHALPPISNETITAMATMTIVSSNVVFQWTCDLSER